MITIEQNIRETTISSLDMEVGDTGIIIDDQHHNTHLILRCFESFVSLTNPAVTWSFKVGMSRPDFRIVPVDIHIIATKQTN